MDKETALKTARFHYGKCQKTVGPRGGETWKIELWRRNGANRLWSRDQTRFEIPIKYGLRGYGLIHSGNVGDFHAEIDCPLMKEEVDG